MFSEFFGQSRNQFVSYPFRRYITFPGVPVSAQPSASKLFFETVTLHHADLASSENIVEMSDIVIHYITFKHIFVRVH